MSWTIIVPVKDLGVAKSRLRGALAGVNHQELVLAMALDTVSAALASPVVGRVVVVTGDPTMTDEALRVGADIIADLPEAGLNPALAYAAAVARPMGASVSLPGVAALTADLPALRAEELTDALRSADRLSGAASTAPARAYVADAARLGTVLLAATPGARLEPCFGAGSAAAHTASGAIELTGAWPGLRRDVDKAADFDEAILLGVGSRTRAVASAIRTGIGSRTDAVHGAAGLTGG